MNNKPNPNSRRQRCLAALYEGPLTTHQIYAKIGETDVKKVSHCMCQLVVKEMLFRVVKNGHAMAWSTEFYGEGENGIETKL